MDDSLKNLDLVTRIQKFETEYRTLLEKYGLTADIAVTFPMYNPKMIPAEIRLALEVIRKHNPVYRATYSDNK